MLKHSHLDVNEDEYANNTCEGISKSQFNNRTKEVNSKCCQSLKSFSSSTNSTCLEVDPNKKKELISQYSLNLEQSIDQGNFESSIEQLETLVRLDAPVDILKNAFEISIHDNKKYFNRLYQSIKWVMEKYPDDMDLISSYTYFIMYNLRKFLNDKEIIIDIVEKLISLDKCGHISISPRSIDYVFSLVDNLDFKDEESLNNLIKNIKDKEVVFILYKKSFEYALSKRQFDKANTYFKHVSKADKNYLKAIYLINTGDPKKAKNILLELEKDKDNQYKIDIWLNLADAFKKLYEYKEAICYYKKILNQRPEDYYVLPDITFCYLALNQASEAFNFVSKIINNCEDPIVDFDDSFFSSLMLFADFNKFEYLAKLINIIKEQPDLKPIATFCHAVDAYKKNANIKEFIACMDEITNSNNDNPIKDLKEYVDTYITALIKEKFYAKAYELLKGLEYSNSTTEAMEIYCLTKLNKNNDNNLDNIDTKSNNTEVSKKLEYAFVTFEDHINQEISLNRMQELLKKYPNNVLALNYVGYYLSKKGIELSKAELMLEKAAALSPYEPYIMDSLAWVKYKLDKNEEAFKLINDCTKYGVTEPLIWEHYGDIAASLNKFKEAKDAYNRALKLPLNNSKVIKDKLKNL